MIIYNTQTDKRWSMEVMTKKDGYWIDLIGRWGCFVTSIANVFSLFSNKQMTPKDLNDIIIQLKAYAFLNDPSTTESNASILLIDKLMKNFPSIEYRLSDNYVNIDDYLFVAEITHPKTKAPHFVNLLGKYKENYIIFDVEDGLVKTVSSVLSLRRFKKI